MIQPSASSTVEISEEVKQEIWTHFSLVIFTAIESLLQHCCQLTILDISGCGNITNASVELLALYCASEERPSLTCTVGGRDWSIDLRGTGTTKTPCFHCDVNFQWTNIFGFVFRIDYRGSWKSPFQVEMLSNVESLMSDIRLID